jgi:uncharacterized protein (DUF58 family)
MIRGRPVAGDVALSVLFFLVFLFAPFRGARLIVLFFFLVHGFSFLASRVLHRAVSVRRLEPVLRVSRLQRFTVALELRNLWPVPLRSVLVSDSTGGVFPDAPTEFLVTLRPRERRVLTWSAEARERGELTLGPVSVGGPGPLGLHRWNATAAAPVRVIVYPALFTLDLEHRRGLPAGNLAVRNRMYEDMSRFRSLREYTPGDELRRINWKATARLGKLHTTEYMQSLYFPVLVVLNLSLGDYPLEGRYALMERVIETAGSLVVYFAGLKQEVGLAATASIPGEDGPVTIPVRPGLAHGVRILEALARVRPRDDSLDFEEVLLGVFAAGRRGGGSGTRVVVVTPPLSAARRGALHTLVRRDWELEVFFVASQATRREDSVMPGVVSHVEGHRV